MCLHATAGVQLQRHNIGPDQQRPHLRHCAGGAVAAGGVAEHPAQRHRAEARLDSHTVAVLLEGCGAGGNRCCQQDTKNIASKLALSRRLPQQHPCRRHHNSCCCQLHPLLPLPHLANPAPQVVWVLHGGAHGQQLDVAGAVDDHLLPHAAAVGVTQVVHLWSGGGGSGACVLLALRLCCNQACAASAPRPVALLPPPPLTNTPRPAR